MSEGEFKKRISEAKFQINWIAHDEKAIPASFSVDINPMIEKYLMEINIFRFRDESADPPKAGGSAPTGILEYFLFFCRIHNVFLCSFMKQTNRVSSYTLLFTNKT